MAHAVLLRHTEIVLPEFAAFDRKAVDDDSNSGDGGDPDKTAQISRVMSLNNSLLAGDYYGRK